MTSTSPAAASSSTATAHPKTFSSTSTGSGQLIWKLPPGLLDGASPEVMKTLQGHAESLLSSSALLLASLFTICLRGEGSEAALEALTPGDAAWCAATFATYQALLDAHSLDRIADALRRAADRIGPPHCPCCDPPHLMLRGRTSFECDLCGLSLLPLRR